MFRSVWQRWILVSLFPALLLLPVVHFHPAIEHGDETHGAHSHGAVVHADFFPSSAHDHGEPHEGKSEPDDRSPSFHIQISFPALLSRSIALLALTLERNLDLLAERELLASVVFSVATRVLVRDHAPPALDFVFLPTSPRAPPVCT